MHIKKTPLRRPDGAADPVPQTALLQPLQHLYPDGEPLHSQLSDRRIYIIYFQKISVIYTVGAPYRPSRDAKDLFRLNAVAGRKVSFHIRFAVLQNSFHLPLSLPAEAFAEARLPLRQKSILHNAPPEKPRL